MFGKTSLQVPMLEKRSRQRFLPNSERRWNNSTRAQQTYEQKNPNQTILQKDSNFGCPNLNYFLISTWLIGQLYYSEKIWKIRPWKRYLTTFAAHPRRYGTIRAEINGFPGSIQNDTEMTGNQGLREQKATSATIIMLKKMFQGRRFCAPNVKPKTTPNPQRRGAKTMTLSLSIVVFRIALGRCSYD